MPPTRTSPITDELVARMRAGVAKELAGAQPTDADRARLRLMKHVRPRVYGAAADVYEHLAPMITDLLLEESTDVVADVKTMLAELAEPAYRDCARDNVFLFELASVMTTALLLGPAMLTKTYIWPHGRETDVSRVRFALLAGALRRALDRSAVRPDGQLAKIAAMYGNYWTLDLPTLRKARIRSTKFPRDPERDGVYRELVRDELFAGRASKQKVARAARLLLLVKPQADVVESEMKRVRAGKKKKGTKRASDPDRLALIPTDFHKTLFARRLRPFLRNPFIAAVLEEPGGEIGQRTVRRGERRRAKHPGAKFLPPSS